ncbi:MAG: thioredoxin fold domain-containing protein [Xanthomonadales bacterium]|nr:thioredoxin fold domain-containing protein [Xanthomonadales bacterium]
MKLLAFSLLTTTSLATVEAKTNDKKAFEQAIQKLTNQTVTVKSVKDTPLKDIKEIVIKNGPGNQIIYMSENGEYLLEGMLMDLKTRKNLTEQTENSLRHDLLEDFLQSHKSIDFLPEDMTEHITVFTDIDCGYCRKLHQEIEGYNNLGIGVSYLFFPRAGLNTSSHQKAINVWCASDQQKAMTQAKNGQELPPLMCPNPIESQYNLGIGAGVHKVGTPAVVFSDGTMIPGYLPAEAMKQRVEQVKSK